jgi:hypothetical protein
MRRRFARSCAAALLCTGMAAGLQAQAVNAAAKPEASRPAVLVELFTSEGCSSCPPADDLLRSVEAKTLNGALIVGISEHVTYWNNLGWWDPYSDDAYTQRQNGYGDRFHLDSVYTPQMVVNGSEQFVGSDGRSLERALRQESQLPRMPLRIVAASIEGGSLNITFTAGVTPGSPVDVMAVVADDMDRSSVSRGENAGHTLQHVAVARLMVRLVTVREVGQKTMKVPLPRDFEKRAGGQHLILFAQAPGQGTVLGTDTQPLR